MGYYNPIYVHGVEKFLAEAKTAGVDGLIVVDLPPEEDEELCLPALNAGLNFIRLATPTTDDARLPAVLANTSGFVYYVSITGITGAAAPNADSVGAGGCADQAPYPSAGRGRLWRARRGERRGDRGARRRRGGRHGAGRGGAQDRSSTAAPGRATVEAVAKLVGELAAWRRPARRGEVFRMNWISNVVPPKIRSLLRRDTPENLWVKCPESGQLVFHKDLEANLMVVPGSGYHMAIAPRARLDALYDERQFETLAVPEVPADPLKFRDIKRYADRLKEHRAKTGSTDAVLAASGRLEGQEVVTAVQDFAFQGGTLGMAAGEAIVAGDDGRGGAARAVHHLHRLRRRAHAGGHVLADADGAHDRRGAAAARGAPALHRRAHQPDHRRRHRVLRHARRHPDRRARRGDRLRRRAGDRADHPRSACPRASSAPSS